ncbi:unnamed protein product [Gordionus sp. m RMFG-2023]
MYKIFAFLSALIVINECINILEALNRNMIICSKNHDHNDIICKDENDIVLSTLQEQENIGSYLNDYLNKMEYYIESSNLWIGIRAKLSHKTLTLDLKQNKKPKVTTKDKYMFNSAITVKRVEGVNGTLKISLGRTVIIRELFDKFTITSERNTNKPYILKYNCRNLKNPIQNMMICRKYNNASSNVWIGIRLRYGKLIINLIQDKKPIVTVKSVYMFNTVMQVKRLEGLNGTLSISIGRKTVQEPIFGNIIITSERGTDKRHYVLQHNGYYLEDSVIHHDLRNPNRYLEGSNKRFILKLEQDEKPNAAIIKRRELVNGALVILRDSETLRQQVFGYIEITTFTVHMVICRRGLTSIYKCENENGDIIYTTEENAEKVINEYLNNTDHRIRTLNLLIGITLGNENVTLALDQDENLKNAGHWWNSDVTVKRLENINGVLIMSTGNKIYYEPVLGFIDLISSNKQAKYLFHLQQYVRNVMICRKHDNFTFICDKDNGHVISTTLGLANKNLSLNIEQDHLPVVKDLEEKLFDSVLLIKRLECMSGTLTISIGHKTFRERVFGIVNISSPIIDAKPYSLQYYGSNIL